MQVLYVPYPICHKKSNLLIMLVNTSANNQVEFKDVKILLSILLVLLFKCKYHQQVNDITQYSCDCFCVNITCFILIYTRPCFFFIFHQVVCKPFKFISNFLQTNETLVTKSNSLSFLSLCLFILDHRSGQHNVQTLLLSICINIFSYLVRNDAAKT